MKHKGSPVYYIEPQLHQAALQAKADGVNLIMVGEGSDLVFGGLAWLLSKDWTVEEFMNIYISTRPEDVLVAPESMQEVFNRYRLANNKMDFLGFIRDVFTIDAYTAYENAFSAACIPYFDPFQRLIWSEFAKEKPSISYVSYLPCAIQLYPFLIKSGFPIPLTTICKTGTVPNVVSFYLLWIFNA